MVVQNRLGAAPAPVVVTLAGGKTMTMAASMNASGSGRIMSGEDSTATPIAVMELPLGQFRDRTGLIRVTMCVWYD